MEALDRAHVSPMIRAVNPSIFLFFKKEKKERGARCNIVFSFSLSLSLSLSLTLSLSHTHDEGKHPSYSFVRDCSQLPKGLEAPVIENGENFSWASGSWCAWRAPCCAGPASSSCWTRQRPTCMLPLRRRPHLLMLIFFLQRFADRRADSDHHPRGLSRVHHGTSQDRKKKRTKKREKKEKEKERKARKKKKELNFNRRLVN
jgi:hypothetical protein